LITFPSSEETAASIRTFIRLEYNDYTNHINHKKMSSCLIAIINSSLNRSQFKIPFYVICIPFISLMY
jgi:hypothetical protein